MLPFRPVAIPRRATLGVLCLAFVWAAPLVLRAQWPGDPSVNLAIADRSADQIVPLIATSPDGSTYVCWFDGASGNLDVYLQRLDALGVEQWPHGGILVSGHPQNTAIFGGWGLIADSRGNAVLTFVDERAGGDLDAQAYRVSPAGAMLWGADGVTLSDNPDFEPGGRVVETTDGDFVFAWQRSATGGGDLRLQRLAADGTPRLAAGGLAVVSSPGEQPGFVEMAAGDNGSVILTWLRDTTSFASPRHLRAQKFAADGSAAWPAPVIVYDTFSLPIGYAPKVQEDGAGGALVWWHRSDGTAYSSFVQHLDASGAELFPHEGLEVSTTAGMFHIDPTLCRDAGNGDLYVFWNERNLGQSQWGIFGQRLSAAGTRMWGTGGQQLLPVDATYKNYPRCVPAADGAMVFVTRSVGVTADELIGMRVDSAGAMVWGAAPIAVSSFPSGKARYPVTVDAAGVARLAWEDDRAGNQDVYGQAVRPDGTLGAIAPRNCLYRANVTTLLPFTPPRSSIFQLATGEGIVLQGPSLQCPFATGDPEPDPNALNNGIPMQLYQVDVSAATIHLRKSGTTLRFDF